MSVTPNEIGYYGSLNMPEADGATIGGAVDVTKKVVWGDMTVNDTIDVVSGTTGDTGVKVQVMGRDATGNIVTSTVGTVNGTVVVANVGSLGTVERIEAAVTTGGSIAGLANPGGTTAIGDIAVFRHTPIIASHTAQTGAANTTGTTPPLFKLQAGDGTGAVIGQIIRIISGAGVNQLRQIVGITGYGTDVVAVNRDWVTLPTNASGYSVLEGMLFELAPNLVKACTRLFIAAQSDVPGGSQRVFYEKIFAINNDTAFAFTGAALQVLSESPSLPSGALLDLALCKALNDTQTDANRQTLPTNGDASALTFVTQPAAVSVIASPGSLPSGAVPNTAGAQGMWLRLTLPAGTATYKGAATVRATGATT